MNRIDTNTRNAMLLSACNLQKFIDLNWGGTICGGFPRDMKLRRTPRDIDLYVSIKDFTQVQNYLRGGSHYMSMDPDIKWKPNGEEGYEHSYVEVCREFELCAGLKTLFPSIAHLPINLIGLRWDCNVRADTDGKSVTNLYNLGLSQAWLNPDAGSLDDVIETSELFDRDAGAGRITVLRDTWGINATKAQLQKLTGPGAKYEGYTVYWPNGEPADEPVQEVQTMQTRQIDFLNDF